MSANTNNDTNNNINNTKNDISIQTTSTIYKPRRSLLCCTKYKDRSNFETILQELDLSEVQKQIIRIRYLNILENIQRRARNYSYVFFSGHFIVTVGSLFVPALLSIQNSENTYNYDGNRFASHIYWTTFVVSLLVTMFNGILTLYKIDKKYYFLNTTLERLRSEGWQYFSLTGRYSGHLIQHNIPTHLNQFIYFTHYVEKIKMKQVEEEYYKAEEKITQTPNNNQMLSSTQQGNELYPPSPDQSITTIANNVPDAVKDAVNSLIKSQITIEQSDDDKNIIVIPENTNKSNNKNMKLKGHSSLKI
jgi:hypothetical protein